MRIVLRSTESRRFDPNEHYSNVPLPTDSIPLIGIIPCSSVNLIVATMQARRELEYHEAMEIVAACALPSIGRAVVHRIFWDHPEWDEAARRRYRPETSESRHNLKGW